MAALTTIAAYASLAAAAVGGYQSYEQGKMGRRTAAKQQAALEQKNQDTAAQERAKAEADAAQSANSMLAARNKARQASSLLAKPDGGAMGGEVSVLAGKTKLGQ